MLDGILVPAFGIFFRVFSGTCAIEDVWLLASSLLATRARDACAHVRGAGIVYVSIVPSLCFLDVSSTPFGVFFCRHEPG